MISAQSHPIQCFASLSGFKTPAYVYDLSEVEQSAQRLATLACDSGLELLYAIKACDAPGVIETVAKHVSGFSCSSVHEIDLARRFAGPTQVHWISPLITTQDNDYIFSHCHNVVLNSSNQLDQWATEGLTHGNVGLRINPLVSFVTDFRCDPCWKGSRLGVRSDDMVQLTHSQQWNLVRGLHFHTNCDSTDGTELLATVREVISQFGPLIKRLEWLNIGGGYLPNEWSSDAPLYEAVSIIKRKWDCRIYFEPGAAFVRDAGYLVSRVGDIVGTPAGKVAILDTSVNHWPEVFEYQFAPDVVGDYEHGEFIYTLAGRSCLAGDVFGEYAFETPLTIGDTIIFSGAGAYSLVKAHRFNGLNLPELYYVKNDRLLQSSVLQREAPNSCREGVINEDFRATT